jgi:hypothetical protein
MGILTETKTDPTPEIMIYLHRIEYRMPLHSTGQFEDFLSIWWGSRPINVYILTLACPRKSAHVVGLHQVFKSAAVSLKQYHRHSKKPSSLRSRGIMTLANPRIVDKISVKKAGVFGQSCLAHEGVNMHVVCPYVCRAIISHLLLLPFHQHRINSPSYRWSAI